MTFFTLFWLVGGMTVCFHYSLLFLKLWSYIQVNMWCRDDLYDITGGKSRSRSQSISIAELRKSYALIGKNLLSQWFIVHLSTFTEEKRNGTYMANHNQANKQDTIELTAYPDNLTFKDLLYFLCAPTLCYELNFPRTTRIRKRFLLKRCAEVIIGANVVLGLFQQWIIPSVQNSLIPFSNMDMAKATERLLKLAVMKMMIFFF